MRAKDREIAAFIDEGLRRFEREETPLPGLRDPSYRAALLSQMVESVRRVRFVAVLRTQELSLLRGDPSSDLFDPLKASVLHLREGAYDEACWLVFLSVHFGKHRRSGWRLARDIYGRLGESYPWSWALTSADPMAFREWLHMNQARLKSDGIPRHFGNHRKYQSLDAFTSTGTGAAIESYVNWVRPFGTHQELVRVACDKCGQDRRSTFDFLYRSMASVVSFGRTGRFDYLTMLGNLELAPIEPGLTYMQGATGPLAGARLLFTGDAESNLSRVALDRKLIRLESYLKVGMQVMEDSLCNWQKSPGTFKPFRG